MKIIEVCILEFLYYKSLWKVRLENVYLIALSMLVYIWELHLNSLR